MVKFDVFDAIDRMHEMFGNDARLMVEKRDMIYLVRLSILYPVRSVKDVNKEMISFQIAISENEKEDAFLIDYFNKKFEEALCQMKEEVREMDG